MYQSRYKSILSSIVLSAVIVCSGGALGAKEEFERTKPHVNIGTISHVDHGKTTLTTAITSSPDPYGTHAHGITIDGDYDKDNLGKRRYEYVGGPDDAGYVKNMKSGH